MNALAQLLLKEKSRLNMSIRDFAAVTNVSHPQLAKIMKTEGPMELRIGTLIGISKRLGLSLEEAHKLSGSKKLFPRVKADAIRIGFDPDSLEPIPTSLGGHRLNHAQFRKMKTERLTVAQNDADLTSEYWYGSSILHNSLRCRDNQTGIEIEKFFELRFREILGREFTDKDRVTFMKILLEENKETSDLLAYFLDNTYGNTWLLEIKIKPFVPNRNIEEVNSK
ncbi:MAG: helix-turn-helix transcriptional regulator [Negativicutes bacterium]|nr:helix-turn-helix transcriptional regulator [Negativicutes bacterium]